MPASHLWVVNMAVRSVVMEDALPHAAITRVEPIVSIRVPEAAINHVKELVQVLVMALVNMEICTNFNFYVKTRNS